MDDKPLIAAPTQDEIDNVRGFRETKWNSYPNFECIYCQYSTLWPEKMAKHQSEGIHVWAYPGQNETAEGDPGPAGTPEY